jgi:hypothetical protein
MKRAPKDWLDQCITLSPKAKRTLTKAGAAQFEHDQEAVANMRRLLAERQADIDAARPRVTKPRMPEYNYVGAACNHEPECRR